MINRGPEYELPENPVFNTTMPSLAEETPAHADEFNPMFEQLLRNDQFLNAEASKHVHDDRYYTEGEVESRLAGKSDTSHGHTASQVGAAAAGHTHTAAQLGAAPANHAHSAETITGLNSVATTGYVSKGQRAGTTLGLKATAEGEGTTASGEYSHAEGGYTKASAEYSHAEGCYTVASGSCSHAGGFETEARDFQCVIGKYNIVSDGISGTDGDVFIIGNGTMSSKSNVLRVNAAGVAYAKGAWNSTGADIAELKEWADGNPNNEDRRGTFVTFDGKKIRFATSVDDDILGAVSAFPSVVGNSFADEWQGKFLTDIFGAPIYEDYENENGEKYQYYSINPDYVDEAYVPREKRPEWSYVASCGEVVLVDDGSCITNGYCLPNDSGTATATTDKRGYRVLGRKDETHILVWVHGRILL